MLDKIINWSEVWGLVIPLLVIICYRPQGNKSHFIKYYVYVALVLNISATLITEFYFSLPVSLRNNNILYNLHSITRVLFFSFYLLQIRKYGHPQLLRLLIIAYLCFVAVEFIFIKSPFYLNTQLFVAESILLLVLSLMFFLRSMQDESNINWLKHPAFLVCTGICLYQATSFFIFLFFYSLVETNFEFAYLTMTIHNIMYVIFCVMLGLALYKSRKKLAA